MLQRIASLLRMQPPIIENRGLLWASGSTVPADGTDGYQTGCLFQHTDGGADTSIYVNEGTVTSCDFNPSLVSSLNDLADVGAALAYTSGLMLVADGSVYQETDDIYLPKTGTFRLGDWVAAGATTGGKVFAAAMNIYSDGQLDILQVHGVNTSDLTSAYSAKCGRFRNLVSGAFTCNQETYGVVGQLIGKSATLAHLHAGVMGTLEGNTTALISNSTYTYGVAAIIARVGGGGFISAASKPICGVLAFWNGAALSTGRSIAFGACASSTTPWTTGLCFPVGSVYQGIRVGDWVGSGAAGSAILFSANQNIYADGQLDIVSAYGESTSDLTSAYSAKVGRFRHVVVGSTTTIAHETYGLVGQLVAKSVVLTHLHAGLMGTLEGNTTAVTSTPAYRYGTACVSGRIGGTNLITATTPVAGFSAIFNGAALTSGTSVAFAVTKTSTGSWDYVLGVANPGTGAFVNGVSIVDGVAGDTGSQGTVGYDALMKVDIGGTDYYIALFDAGSVTGE